MIVHSDLLNLWQSRGFVHQTTPLEALDSALQQPITLYHGCDATANSLHIGHLCGLMALKWAQTLGHRTILLMGGGTTKIGDPSGRSTLRPILSDEDIAHNIAGLLRNCFQILDVERTLVVNNAQWLDELGYVAFLREVGRHFSVNRMLQCESVRLRLDREDHLSFIEFNYMLLQAYDFLQLHRSHNCVLQVGGGDQWGNIVSGVDLIRRIDGHSVHALTWPLLETIRGEKMGKTAAGAVWLDAEKTSVWHFWQYWRNVDDRDLCRFLALFTMLPLEDIERWKSVQGQELNEGKILLADTVTDLVHGEAARHQVTAMRTSDNAQLDGGGCDVYALTEQDHLNGGVVLFKILVALGWVKSGREAKQKIEQGAVKIDGEKVTDPLFVIDLAMMATSRRISYGAKHMAMIQCSEKD